VCVGSPEDIPMFELIFEFIYSLFHHTPAEALLVLSVSFSILLVLWIIWAFLEIAELNKSPNWRSCKMLFFITRILGTIGVSYTLIGIPIMYTPMLHSGGHIAISVLFTHITITSVGILTLCMAEYGKKFFIHIYGANL
jgi:hypothetical protein